MNGRRVVITGMGAISPFGEGVDCLWENLLEGNSAVRVISGMDNLDGLRSSVAATVPEISEKKIDRKKRRFMSAMSIYSTLAAMEAVSVARLSEAQLTSRKTGLCLASTTGSSAESEAFFRQIITHNTIEQVKSTMFFKTMNHTCSANTGQALGIRGRTLAPSAACASGSLAVGLAYESIVSGHQDIMVCGGADEYHNMATAVFDIMNAASCGYNDKPSETPRPFDVARDGVVCAEGAGVLVLEGYEHAKARNAPIIAEVAGFATYSSPGHIAHPDTETMIDCIKLAMEQAEIGGGQIDYVNAHATATPHGDVAEGMAVMAAIGENTKISSLKGHLGHTMAASGALELIASIQMMDKGLLIPTRNLDTVDPQCGKLDFLKTVTKSDAKIILKNSFALGGVNCTLIVKKCDGV